MAEYRSICAAHYRSICAAGSLQRIGEVSDGVIAPRFAEAESQAASDFLLRKRASLFLPAELSLACPADAGSG